MIIKHPEMAQIEGLTALWVEAFEEPKEAAQCFFDSAFAPRRSLVCLERDAVAAGLYWFDCLWKGRKVAYIYAVGTRIAHRGKGLCHALMEKTHEVLKSRGYHGAILVPAEESLFGFYGEMGYVDCCPGGIPGEKLTAQREREMGLTPISMEAYLEKQKQLLPKDAVVHTATAYEYLKHFAEFYAYDGGIVCKIEEDIQERLPWDGRGEMASMYLPLTEDIELPGYFAHPLA